MLWEWGRHSWDCGTVKRGSMEESRTFGVNSLSSILHSAHAFVSATLTASEWCPSQLNYLKLPRAQALLNISDGRAATASPRMANHQGHRPARYRAKIVLGTPRFINGPQIH